jgi:hypothetical protein
MVKIQNNEFLNKKMEINKKKMKLFLDTRFIINSLQFHFLQFPMYCAEIRGLEIVRFGNCRIAHAKTLKIVMSKGQEFSVEF